MEFEPVDLVGEWFYLDVEIYFSRVFVFVGDRKEVLDSIEDALTSKFEVDLATARRLKECCEETWAGHLENNVGYDSVGYERDFVVRLNSMETGNLDDLLILNHECLHIALVILDMVGVVDRGHHEALCYLHEHIVRKLVKQMCERGFGKFKMDTQPEVATETIDGTRRLEQQGVEYETKNGVNPIRCPIAGSCKRREGGSFESLDCIRWLSPFHCCSLDAMTAIKPLKIEWEPGYRG